MGSKTRIKPVLGAWRVQVTGRRHRPHAFQIMKNIIHTGLKNNDNSSLAYFPFPMMASRPSTKCAKSVQRVTENNMLRARVVKIQANPSHNCEDLVN